MIQGAGGQTIFAGPVTHMVINISNQQFDDIVSANLEQVDPPDATMDIPVKDQAGVVVGDATVSVQLRPKTIDVTLDQSTFLHSDLTVVVQVDVPGQQQTRVLEGRAKTRVQLTAGKEKPSRTLIQAGSLAGTSIALNNEGMGRQWSDNFKSALRRTTTRLVGRSTSTVQRAIEVIRVEPPETSFTDLRMMVKGFRQPRGSERIFIELVTNLRVGTKDMELPERASSLPEDLLRIHMHPNLPLAWLRQAFLQNPQGVIVDSAGLRTEPPGFTLVPQSVKKSPGTHDFVVGARLFDYQGPSCRNMSLSKGADIPEDVWTRHTIRAFRLTSLVAAGQRAFIELLFGGAISFGSRDMHWEPRLMTREKSRVWSFEGRSELHERTLQEEADQEGW